ncbi:MAG: hypothetical protein HY832_02295 [Candidatus Aenigmarchaeota archaeon]|nr:hypothetical protein [Candidatus Aenigmarchaeota archaeon]
MEISEDIRELVKVRLTEMPSHIKLSIGNFGSFDRNQLIEHVEKGDEIGKTIVEMELTYIQALKKLV